MIIDSKERGVLTLIGPEWIWMGRIVMPWAETGEEVMVVFVVVGGKGATRRSGQPSGWEVQKRVGYANPNFYTSFPKRPH